MSDERRVLIVSNRLPLTVRSEPNGVVCTPTSGGLATGLRTLHENSHSLWIGWPGDLSSVQRKQRADLVRQLEAQRIVPVQLNRTEQAAYYDGFCNGVLWPLFHYLVDRLPTGPANWDTYRAINERFVDKIVEHYRPGDLVWVHDYQLLLVPELLRWRLPDADIGFFLHVPFPAADVFRILPWRREVLAGMLGASLVGFHTEDYASHFIDAVRSLTALEIDDRVINANERPVRVGAYPMGVDAGWFSRMADSPEVLSDRDTIVKSPGEQILLGIDRLDYTKGIPRRLLAYEQLLIDNPALRGRIRLIQVAVPSRSEVPSYQKFRQQVEETVGRINGRLATVDWTPIWYLHQTVSPSRLVALYRAADVMLVTPLRDGMNLVAKEFVASRTDLGGVLLLSEFAGAACEFPEAVAVNPYSIDEMAATMKFALTMDATERRRRMQALRRRVTLRDVNWWAATFVRHLQQMSIEEPREKYGLLPDGAATDATLM